MYSWATRNGVWRHRDGDSGAGSGGGSAEGEGEGEGESGDGGKTYTTKELQGIVAKAVAKAVKPFANHQELVAKAEELEELRSQQLTGEERMRQKFDKTVVERDVAMSRAERALIKAAIVAEANRQGAVDVDAVVAMVDRRLLTINAEDEVEGAEEAVKTLLASKGYLKQGGPRRGGTDFSQPGGTNPAVQRITQSMHRQWLRDGITPEQQEAVRKAQAAGTYIPGQ